MAMNIIVLAAGKGTRMKSAVPKVLQPIAGKPLIQHVLATARLLDAAATPCVVLGHGAEAVAKALPVGACTVALQTEQLGTGHAVMQAVPFLSAAETSLVMYGDVPLIQAQTLAALAALVTPNTLALLTARAADPMQYGRIVRNAVGAVTAIVEFKDCTPEQKLLDEVNTGFMALPTAWMITALPRLKNHNKNAEYYLTDLVALAVQDGLEVAAPPPLAISNSEWEGVNDRVDLAARERDCQRLQAQALMRAGVHIIDETRITIRGVLEAVADVQIDVGCVFEGKVTLAAGVVVGAYCVLRDVSVGAGTVIEPFSHLQGAAVGEDNKIGPFARLRPGAVLAKGVHIGNFTEIKNAQLDEGSKANHLSYIGDATIGKRVNIGAGTITCNYDGVNKHRTVIEDDVFVGSDTQLIAPITVGRGATLAAGTTLSKDAPANMLTLTRAEQRSVRWRKPVKRG
jgi:bifunctional UDP-N-acetylglucosamine pyrophosphorylase / glucosamine-1-phosphate N-acetyltransferase